MTTIPCPSWCVLGDDCEGYHQSAPVAAPLPMTTGREFGDALAVTVGHLEAEDFPPEIVVSPQGFVLGGGDSLSLRINEVRTLIAALDDALFVLGEVTELTRARQQVAGLEAKAEEAKDAWMQACDDGGSFALQVEAAHDAADELDAWDGHPSASLGGVSPGGLVRHAMHEAAGVTADECTVCSEPAASFEGLLRIAATWEASGRPNWIRAAENLRASLPEVCHCGERVVYGYDGDPAHHRGMCAHCDAVRCDADPGACGRPTA